MQVSERLVLVPVSHRYDAIITFMNGRPGGLGYAFKTQPGVKRIYQTVSDGGVGVAGTPGAFHIVSGTEFRRTSCGPGKGQRLVKKRVEVFGEGKGKHEVLQHQISLGDAAVEAGIIGLDIMRVPRQPMRALNKPFFDT